jgi:hypothetical protein
LAQVNFDSPAEAVLTKNLNLLSDGYQNALLDGDARWGRSCRRVDVRQLGREDCRQERFHQVFGALVRPLQVAEAQLGQAHG